MVKWLVGAVAMAALLSGCGAVGGLIGKGKPTATPVAETRIGKAAADCGTADMVQDLGASITLDTRGDDEATTHATDATYEEAVCFLNAINVPSAVLDHIGQTRALDGFQTDAWDGYSARWNYHPDTGMNLTIVDDQFKAPTT